MIIFVKKLLTLVAIVCAVAFPAVSALKDDDIAGIIGTIKEKYDGLNPKQRFWAGAAAGFVGSRLALSSAMTAIKIGGVAFITAEVLHYTGVLEDIPSLSEEQNEMFLKIKGEAMRYAENFRVQVRRRLDPKRMRVVMEKERSATLGLASGAVLGFVL